MTNVNREQIDKVAELLRSLPETAPPDFTLADSYPSRRHPQTINFFFFACLHMYGFWYGNQYGYDAPLYGTWQGKRTKGSELLLKMMKGTLDDAPIFFEPERLSCLTEEQFSKLFSDDSGSIALFDHKARFNRTRRYAEWFTENGITPEIMVEESNKEWEPLHHFVTSMRAVPGFEHDPFKKRNMLLALYLSARPEKFLKTNDPENWRPIVDYHNMRVALRLGLVELTETEKWYSRNRLWVNAREEHLIRAAVYEALIALVKESGKSMAFVDNKLFHARRYCPETETPKCEDCVFASLCFKRTELFQPIFRTTAY